MSRIDALNENFHTHEKPFDIDLGDIELLTTLWFSIDDSFPKGEGSFDTIST